MRNIILITGMMLLNSAAIAVNIDDFSQDTTADYQLNTILGQGEPSVSYRWDGERKMLHLHSSGNAKNSYGASFISNKTLFQGDGYIAVDVEEYVDSTDQKSWHNVSLCLYDTAMPNEFKSSSLVGNGYKIQIYNGGQIQVKKMVDGSTASFIGIKSWVPYNKPFTLKIKRQRNTYYFYMNNIPLAVDSWSGVDLKYWGLIGAHDKATSMDVKFDNLRMAASSAIEHK